MKRLRVKKHHGEWLYVKTLADGHTFYGLYKVEINGYRYIGDFVSYREMKIFVEMLGEYA